MCRIYSANGSVTRATTLDNVTPGTHYGRTAKKFSETSVFASDDESLSWMWDGMVPMELQIVECFGIFVMDARIEGQLITSIVQEHDQSAIGYFGPVLFVSLPVKQFH